MPFHLRRNQAYGCQEQVDVPGDVTFASLTIVTSELCQMIIQDRKIGIRDIVNGANSRDVRRLAAAGNMGEWHPATFSLLLLPFAVAGNRGWWNIRVFVASVWRACIGPVLF